jgi:acetyl esterase/lipase
MTIEFDAGDLAATRKANDRLNRMPRLRLQSWIHRNLIQGLMALGNWIGSDVAAKAGVATENRTVSALGRTARVRILRPPGPLHGVHVHIHGGGWTIGNARMDDAMNAQLALGIHVAVVSVDYRLIPAFAFTDCIDDCETAARWVLEACEAEFGVDRITIGGESAGGHLAAATILRLRDAGTHFSRVKGAALTYGCYDLGGTEMRRRAGPETLVLHGPTMSRILDKARGITAGNRRDPSLSPLYAELTGLPPALFVVGTRDPLQEDTELMYAKWVRQSHNAQLAIVPEGAHGFNKQATSTAEKTNAFIHHWIGRQLAG